MKLRYKVAGSQRKKLVDAISKVLLVEPVYKGTPSYAFLVGDYTVDRDGTLLGPDSPEAEEVVRALVEEGFVAEEHRTLSIEMPRAGFTEAALENLRKLVESKSDLIQHALGVTDLPIEVTDELVRFPWFTMRGGDAEVSATPISTLAPWQNKTCIGASRKRWTMKRLALFTLTAGFIRAEYRKNENTSKHFNKFGFLWRRKQKAAYKRKALRLLRRTLNTNHYFSK